jgi:hypothetical protein
MSGNLCEHCTAACCRYVALPIEEPVTRSDFEDVRWYLIHDNVSVFVEDGDWYISFATPCRHLLDDHRCGIYHTRPKICRDYTTDNCDYHSGDYGWEVHFTSPDHLDAYLKAHPVEKAGSRGRKSPARSPAASLHQHGRLKADPSRLRHRRTKPVNEQRDHHGVPLPILPR